MILDLGRYPCWWPEVRAVARIDAETAWLVCRSRLPYSLDLIARATSQQVPRLEVALEGDLVGFARFDLAPIGQGERTQVGFSQQVQARGLLAVASLLARPLLRWNHRLMMRSCHRGLASAPGPAGI